eukprot:m.71870 g.71870  ORF g.71870 m.71870 type:complete len:346 (+) comp35766_c0_seq3:106-1143(+)
MIVFRTSFVVFALLAGVLQGTKAHSSFWKSMVEILEECTLAGGALDIDCIPSLLKMKPETISKKPSLDVPGKYRAFLPYVVYGAAEGILECQTEFAKERWNCSLASSYFLNLMESGTREQAYVAATVSAGIIRELAKSCATGGEEMHRLCSEMAASSAEPGKPIQPQHSSQCQNLSDNVDFGIKFFKTYLQLNGFNSTVNVYSGFLSAKWVKRLSHWRVCWVMKNGMRNRIETFYGVPTMKAVGKRLRKIYDKGCSTDKNKKCFHCDNKSSSHCLKDKLNGSLGTSGRVCKPKSDQSNGCSHLCCGRGYKMVEKIQTYKCKCTFIWCCHWQCEQCEERTRFHVCK